MTQWRPASENPLHRAFHGGARYLGVAALVIGLDVLSGWILGFGLLRFTWAGWAIMKVNTALGIALAAGALLLQAAGRERMGRLLAGGVAFIGLLTLTEYLGGIDLGIDEVLISDTIRTADPYPGRPAPNTAVAIALLGFSLLFFDARARAGIFPAEAAAIGAHLVALLAASGYLFGVLSLYGRAASTRMSPHATVAILCLSVGVLFARPDRGVASRIASGSEAGAMLRRLLPTLAVVLFGLSWIRLQGQRLGLFGTEFGVAAMVVVNLVLLSGALMVCVGLFERARADRDRLFDLSHDLICVADFDGRFRVLNPAWEKTLGFPRTEMIGRKFLDFVHPEDRAATALEAGRLAEGSAGTTFENRYVCSDGSNRRLLWTTAVDRTARAYYAIAHDVTEDRRLREQLVNQTAALAAANKELEAFTYSVSHDLRAPLRATAGFARILEEEYGPGLDEEARRLLAIVRGSAHRMGRLIDDLLDFSRLGRKPVEHATVEMGELVRSAVEESRRIAPDRNVTVAIDRLPAAHGDLAMLRQVWMNLVGNAFKYTQNRADSRIEIGGFEVPGGGNGGWIEYYVSDNGAGFDPRYASKLFGVFQRLHSEAEFEGTGVGLALVKRIIERHGGNVLAEGMPGEGARFSFRVPAEAVREI